MAKYKHIALGIGIAALTSVVIYVLRYQHIHRIDNYFKYYAIDCNRGLPEEMGTLCVLDSVVFENDTLFFHGAFQDQYKQNVDSKELCNYYDIHKQEIRFDMMSFFVTAMQQNHTIDIIDKMKEGGVVITHVIHISPWQKVAFSFSGDDLVSHSRLINASKEFSGNTLAKLLCNQLTRTEEYGILNGTAIGLNNQYCSVNSVFVDEEHNMVVVQFVVNWNAVRDSAWLDFAEPYGQLLSYMRQNSDMDMILKLAKTLHTTMRFDFLSEDGTEIADSSLMTIS